MPLEIYDFIPNDIFVIIMLQLLCIDLFQVLSKLVTVFIPVSIQGT